MKFDQNIDSHCIYDVNIQNTIFLYPKENDYKTFCKRITGKYFWTLRSSYSILDMVYFITKINECFIHEASFEFKYDHKVVSAQKTKSGIIVCIKINILISGSSRI